MNYKSKLEAEVYDQGQKKYATTAGSQIKNTVIEDDCLMEKDYLLQEDSLGLLSFDLSNSSHLNRCPRYGNDQDNFSDLSPLPQPSSLAQLSANFIDNTPVFQNPQLPIPPNMSTFYPKSNQFVNSPNRPVSLSSDASQDFTCREKDDTNKMSIKIDVDKIFQEQPIERSRNITKAIRKYMQRHLDKYKNHFEDNEILFKNFKKQLKETKGEYFSRQSIMKLFSQQEVPQKLRSIPRLVTRKILNSKLRQQIIPNNQVKQKETYLVATKVYSLRCMSEQLISRVQMR